MSEEELYIDDGELVYYINENEFIACDEIPMPMLEGIKHLQQKVEQLEKENDKLKYLADDSNTMKAFVVEHNKVEQLENIRKEAVEYIKKNLTIGSILDGEKTYCLNSYSFDYEDLLNILNKGDNNGK